MTTTNHSRRSFLAVLAGALAPVALGAGSAVAAPPFTGMRRARLRRQEHPDPRPGIDASRVLPTDRVDARLVELYDRIREIPQIADGIRCACGCADLPDMYSLLSCYEESGMAQHCAVCQGVGELVYEMHREGRTLDEIRAAVDRRSW